MLIKNFDCNNCTKEKICKYKEIETPEIISKVEGRIDNEYCPPIINFIVSCEEFQEKKQNFEYVDIIERVNKNQCQWLGKT